MYAFLKGFKFQEVECPYISARPTMRAKVRDLMYALEEKSPGFLLRLVENFDRIGEEVRRRANLPPFPHVRCAVNQRASEENTVRTANFSSLRDLDQLAHD